MPDKIKMKDFGKKSFPKKTHKNPIASWEQIIIITDWAKQWHNRTDTNLFYTVSACCQNCGHNVTIAIMKGFEKPINYLCPNCETVQPPHVREDTYGNSNPGNFLPAWQVGGIGGGVGY